MTYAEKYKNSPLHEVLEVFRAKRWELDDFNLTIRDFLDMEVPEFKFKFKVGDLIQVDHNCPKAKLYGWIHDAVFEVISHYYVDYSLKLLTPYNDINLRVGSIVLFERQLIDSICHKY